MLYFRADVTRSCFGSVRLITFFPLPKLTGIRADRIRVASIVGALLKTLLEMPCLAPLVSSRRLCDKVN